MYLLLYVLILTLSSWFVLGLTAHYWSLKLWYIVDFLSAGTSFWHLLARCATDWSPICWVREWAPDSTAVMPCGGGCSASRTTATWCQRAWASSRAPCHACTPRTTPRPSPRGLRWGHSAIWRVLFMYTGPNVHEESGLRTTQSFTNKKQVDVCSLHVVSLNQMCQVPYFWFIRFTSAGPATVWGHTWGPAAPHAGDRVPGEERRSTDRPQHERRRSAPHVNIWGRLLSK